MILTQRLIFGLLALSLLALGLPRLYAATMMAIGEPIYRDYTSGKSISKDQAKTLIETREAALAAANWPRAATDLGAAYVINNTSPEALATAISSVRHGLQLAPMSPFAWQRLSDLELYVQNYPEALKAWRTARALSEFEPFLYYARIRTGIRLYAKMSPQDREVLRSDVNLAYTINRGQLKRYAKQKNLLEWMKFLLRDPEKTKYLLS
jgi:hypothetical protein